MRLVVFRHSVSRYCRKPSVTDCNENEVLEIPRPQGKIMLSDARHIQLHYPVVGALKIRHFLE